MFNSNIVVWVADVGSIAKGNFGWCRTPPQEKRAWDKRNDIGAFAEGIAEDLLEGKRIALGFECPLFVPVAEMAQNLTKARKADSSLAWSAGTGATALVVGLVEYIWVFERIKENLESAQKRVQPTFDWTEFNFGKANLFIWEAFVSGDKKSKSKSDPHVKDAAIAAGTFWSNYPNIVEADSERAQNSYSYFSLVGAALLRSGLVKDLSILSEPCIVIRS